jgi:hypothetical protein
VYRTNFGWLAERHRLHAGPVTVEPLHSSREGFGFVLSSPRVRDDWFYPPVEPEWMSANDIGNAHINFAPWFSLPPTHRLVLPVEDADCASFVIAAFGVVKGLQLVPEGWGHFYRTPIKPGRRVDFDAKPSACERILRASYDFSDRDQTIRRLMFGAMHWHLFGLSYDHPFEQFGVAYSVLDTCWRVHCAMTTVSAKTPHANRIVELCSAYDLAVPSWAVIIGKSSRLATLRNEYFHESLWGGHPIGFAHPADVPDIQLELFWFNTRLLLAMLGDRSNYTKSAISYQRQLLT